MLTEAEGVLERRTTWIFRVGLAIYVLSLLLPAVEDRTGESFPGFVLAFESIGWGLFLVNEFFRTQTLWTAVRVAAMMPSAWTNILLAITVWNQWAQPDARRTFWLRLATVATIPLSWLAFANQREQIREGHVAWLIAIALILFCRPLSASISRRMSV